MTSRCWRVAGAALLLAPALMAQVQTVPLSLKKAVEIALAPDGNTRVRIAAELVRQAESRSRQSRAALLPNVDSQASYQSVTRNLSTMGISFHLPVSIPGFSVPQFVGPIDVVDMRASISQSVFDYSNIRRYQASKVSIDASRADDANTRNQVSDQATRAYLIALRAQQVLETANANVALAERIVRLSREQKEAGTATGIEVTRADVQLALERQRRIAASNDLDQALLQLARVINLPFEAKIELTGKLKFVDEPAADPAKALEVAKAERADWKAQERRETAARMSFDAVKWERLPSVAAFGDYGPTGTAVDAARPTRTAGVAVKVPIWDGGRRDARRAESASQIRQEELRTRDLRKQMELELRSAADSLRTSSELVKVTDDALKLSENELAQAERRYKAGVGTSVEVTDAQTRLARARETQVNAVFAHNLARVDWNTAQGTIRALVDSF